MFVVQTAALYKIEASFMQIINFILVITIIIVRNTVGVSWYNVKAKINCSTQLECKF